MALFCTQEAEPRQYLRVGRRVNYRELIGTNSGARKPILTSQAPSLQLVGSGEATSLGITGCE
jgi:hypothetical protein